VAIREKRLPRQIALLAQIKAESINKRGYPKGVFG